MLSMKLLNVCIPMLGSVSSLPDAKEMVGRLGAMNLLSVLTPSCFLMWDIMWGVTKLNAV